MSDNEQAPRDKRAALLGELTALRAALHSDRQVDMSSIPILDEVIDDEPVVTSHSTRQPPYSEEEDFDREIFLQEVIDSLMPSVEVELRRRLLALDEKILLRWYQRFQDRQ